MKYLFLLVFSTCTITAIAQKKTLEKIWETDATLRVPESALLDEKNKVIYVTNIDGKPSEKDGNGSVGKITPEGRIINVEWVKGLNAPKGMGLYKDQLYVADLTEVVVIDVNAGSIAARISIDGAKGLNDVTVSSDGIVYISDKATGKIHRINNGIASEFMTDLPNVNGLLALDDDLYYVANGSFYKADKNKTVTTLSTGMAASTDGIVQVKKNEFIISCWEGVVYYVNAKGENSILLDTRETKGNTADIWFNAKSQTLYVPTFYGNTIVAYHLK